MNRRNFFKLIAGGALVATQLSPAQAKTVAKYYGDSVNCDADALEAIWKGEPVEFIRGHLPIAWKGDVLDFHGNEFFVSRMAVWDFESVEGKFINGLHVKSLLSQFAPRVGLYFGAHFPSKPAFIWCKEKPLRTYVNHNKIISDWKGEGNA